jgi:hypothetical protein
LIKDISDFSKPEKKEIGERLKLIGLMTNNLLIEETLDELIQGMELDKFTLTNLTKALPLVYRNRKAISFKIYKPMYESSNYCRKLP